MVKILTIHRDNPQERLLRQVTDALHQAAVIIYPTDSGYALGCGVGQSKAIERIHQIRQLDKDHLFTLICQDFANLSTYAKVDTHTFKILKRNTPAAFTFVLNATKEVPKKLLHSKRKTIGLRLPDHNVCQALVSMHEEPLMSVSLPHKDEGEDLICDVSDISQLLLKQVDYVLDSGLSEVAVTTIVDLTSGDGQVLLQGKEFLLD